MIKKPDPIDVHVGSRVRMRRTLLGLSQQKLGDALGLTFQQIQKYERGANRIGSSKLYRISRFLDVPVSFFFDDMPGDILSASGPKSRDESLSQDVFARRDVANMARGYLKLEPTLQKEVAQLVNSMARLKRSA